MVQDVSNPTLLLRKSKQQKADADRRVGNRGRVEEPDILHQHLKPVNPALSGGFPAQWLLVLA